MTHTAFESILVMHASPVLAGVKPAALISLKKQQFPQLPALAGDYTRMLRRKGLLLQVICQCERHFLLLVYRPALLWKRLSEPAVRACLRRFGYRGRSPADCLTLLKRRLAAEGGFPHEIGLFLGYPPEDVLAFQGEIPGECKFCGYWKVYFHEEEARRLFSLFDRCREAYAEAFLSGKTVSQLLELPLPVAA